MKIKYLCNCGERTKQIDFQMPLHCGMVQKSTPTIYSTPTIQNSKNGGGKILNGGGRLNVGQISTFPSKSLDFVPGHLESLNQPHLVIWQGRIHNTTLHLQHRCINSYFSCCRLCPGVPRLPGGGAGEGTGSGPASLLPPPSLPLSSGLLFPSPAAGQPMAATPLLLQHSIHAAKQGFERTASCREAVFRTRKFWGLHDPDP